MRSEPRKLRGLAPKGEAAITKASKPEKYEPRVDMYGAIAYTGPLVCETVTAAQRKAIMNPRTKKKGVRGYTKSMLMKEKSNECNSKRLLLGWIKALQ